MKLIKKIVARRATKRNKQFIENLISRLLKSGVIKSQEVQKIDSDYVRNYLKSATGLSSEGIS